MKRTPHTPDKGEGIRRKNDLLVEDVVDGVADGLVGLGSGVFGLLGELVDAGFGAVDRLVELFAGGFLLVAGGEGQGRGGSGEDGEREEHFFHDGLPFG